MTSTPHSTNRRSRFTRRLFCAAVASLATSGMMMQHAGTAQAATAAATPTTAPAVPAYENATIADTNYAIPANALYVSNSGSDTNPGSLAAPFASISKALSVAPAGATIVVRGGTYRASLGAIKKPVTIQSYPHEQVWVTGSVVANNFSPDSGLFSMPWSVSMCDTCYPSAALDPSYPAAGLPEQVFVDGAPLAQVTTQSALVSGTFYVDHTAGKIWLYDNPAGHSVEVTQLASAFSVSSAAAGTTIRGIGFEHWAAVYQNGTNAAAMVSANNVTLDSDTFAWSSSRFLGVYGSNDTVTNSSFVDNGMNGVTANLINNFDFERNEIAYSNFEHWDITPSPYAQIAGIKLTGVNDTMLRDNNIHDNAANGLWFDVLSTNQTIVGNNVINNAGHGIAVEVSGYSIIAGNVVAMNGRDGLKISGANNVEVWNNTVVDNGWAQLGVYEDPRHTTGLATSDTTSVRVGNNIFMAGPDSTKYVFYSLDTSNPKHLTTVQMLSADDHNSYGRTSITAPKFLVSEQATLQKSATFTTLAAFTAATGRERASTSLDGLALNALFVNPTGGNFTLVPGVSSLLAAPATLPAGVATAMGSPAVPAVIGA